MTEGNVDRGFQTKSNKRLCITTFVYGWYQHFIPVYVYSVLKSYPHYFVKIFLHSRLETRNRELLNAIRKYGYENFEVVEDYFRDIFNESEYLRTARFFIPGSEFADFDYAYFGDVDFIICKEQPGILEAHAAHCKEIGLPYSNAVRHRDWKDLGFRRLSGLHFVCVPEYYSKVGPLISKQQYQNYKRLIYRMIHLLYSLVGKRRDFDEIVLYDLVKKAFGKPPDVIVQGKHEVFRPHHGIHLGSLRIGRIHAHRVVEWKGFWDQIEGDEGLNFIFENSDIRLVKMFQELRKIMEK